MMDFRQLQNSFESMDGGLPRLHGIRDAIRQADEQQDIYWSFQFRYDYLKESIFCGDRYFAMIIFPELLALYDEHTFLQNHEECRYLMLVAFKWIVEAASEFPQISKKEIDSYFSLFKKRLLENGCSLSIYYMKRNLFYMHCDQSIAAMCFYRFLEAPLDAISDGKALYYDQQVMYYLSVGEEEKALRAAQPIFDGTMTSNALPQATYHEFIRFCTRRGRYAEAMDYAKKTEYRITKDPYYLDIVGSLMTLYGITQPEYGFTLFLAHNPLYQQSRNPALRMQFAIGAAHLFARMQEKGICQLPQAIQLSENAGVQTFRTAAEAQSYFYQAAADAAARFDARNGTDDFMQQLHFQYPQPDNSI